MVNLDRPVESCCNIIDDLTDRLYVPHQTKDVNSRVFKILTWLNESKSLVKQISCDYRCKCDNKKCN